MPPRVAPPAPLSRHRVFMRRVLIMPSKSHTNWLGKAATELQLPVASCKLLLLLLLLLFLLLGRQLLPRNALQVALYHEINKKQKQQRDEKLGRAGQGTGPGSGSGCALAWLGSLGLGFGSGISEPHLHNITAGSHQQAVCSPVSPLPVRLSLSQSLSQATKAAGNFCLCLCLHLCLHLSCGSRNSCLTPINWLPRQSPFGCSARATGVGKGAW